MGERGSPGRHVGSDPARRPKRGCGCGCAGASHLSRLARDRGWQEITPQELSAAHARNPRSLTRALGSRAIVGTADGVFRVPIEEMAQRRGFIDSVPARTGRIPGHLGPPGVPSEDMVPKVLIGPDDRVALVPDHKLSGVGTSFPFLAWNYMRPPYRQMAQISGSCSGFFIGPRHVLTAGHCIQPWNISDPQSLVVASGFTGDSITTPEVASADAVFVLGSGGFNLSSASYDVDIAIVIVPDGPLSIGRGWLGMETVGASTEGDQLRVFGFPPTNQNCMSTNTNPSGLFRPGWPSCGSPVLDQSYIMYDTCSIDQVYDNRILYFCDTTEGTSTASPKFVLRSLDRGEHPAERIGEEGEQLVEEIAKGSRFPAAPRLGHLESPKVFGDSSEASVLVRVLGGAGLDHQQVGVSSHA